MNKLIQISENILKAIYFIFEKVQKGLTKTFKNDINMDEKF